MMLHHLKGARKRAASLGHVRPLARSWTGPLTGVKQSPPRPRRRGGPLQGTVSSLRFSPVPDRVPPTVGFLPLRLCKFGVRAATGSGATVGPDRRPHGAYAALRGVGAYRAALGHCEADQRSWTFTVHQKPR